MNILIKKILIKNILIKPIFGSVYKKNKFFTVDTDVNIFFGFKKKLARLGISINTLDIGQTKDVDTIVFCDLPFFWEIGYILTLIRNRKKSVLFCFEPPIFNPFDYWRIFYLFFPVVYTWNDTLVDDKKIKKFYLPVLDNTISIPEISFKKKKFLHMICGNKSAPYLFVLLSGVKKVFYKERLHAIDFFEKNIPSKFDLYGGGWNKPKKFSLKEKLFGFKEYVSYKGFVSRAPGAKLKIMSKYKFNVCFENCEVEGYISEKIIDCFKAHTVPIYLGAPNIEKYIPKNCFIDFRDFKDYQSLLNYLENMDENTYNKYIQNGKKLLNSKDFKDTLFEEGFLEVFLESIGYEKKN